MVAPYVSDLERLVSKPRLDRYRPPGRDDLQTAVSYLWNVALSEALLQGLSALEIAIRNAVHRTFSAHIGTEYWFQAILAPGEMKMVTETWTKLSQRHNQPPTPGQIIAELMFGFWPPLFDAHYHDLWWNNNAALFKATFPHIPGGLRPHQAIVRKDIHLRVESCQKLRNRVMHHEPIFTGLAILNKPALLLATAHQYITDILGWIDPQLSLTLSVADRFNDVYTRGQTRIQTDLETEIIKLYGHL